MSSFVAVTPYADSSSAAPRPLHFVHGGEGIARRIAYLTQGQDWPAAAPPGKAVFTRLDSSVAALARALADYGLEEMEAL